MTLFLELKAWAQDLKKTTVSLYWKSFCDKLVADDPNKRRPISAIQQCDSSWATGHPCDGATHRAIRRWHRRLAGVRVLFLNVRHLVIPHFV